MHPNVPKGISIQTSNFGRKVDTITSIMSLQHNLCVTPGMHGAQALTNMYHQLLADVALPDFATFRRRWRTPDFTNSWRTSRTPDFATSRRRWRTRDNLCVKRQTSPTPGRRRELQTSPTPRGGGERARQTPTLSYRSGGKYATRPTTKRNFHEINEKPAAPPSATDSTSPFWVVSSCCNPKNNPLSPDTPLLSALSTFWAMFFPKAPTLSVSSKGFKSAKAPPRPLLLADDGVSSSCWSSSSGAFDNVVPAKILS